jgi:DNA-directed RNA polymerase specialized sigma24 family protein
MIVPGPGENDDVIKNLLLSGDSTRIEVGLILLDREYRNYIAGCVRRWSNRYKLRIPPDELADIWQETLMCVTRNVLNGKFTFDGKLGAYLGRIAYCRTIDYLRRLIPNCRAAEEQMETLCSPGSRRDLIERIEACCSRIPETLQVVLRCDVRLFYQEFKWPSLAELTDEVNKQNGLELSTDVVRARRYRARQQLRAILRGTGIQ